MFYHLPFHVKCLLLDTLSRVFFYVLILLFFILSILFICFLSLFIFLLLIFWVNVLSPFFWTFLSLAQFPPMSLHSWNHTLPHACPILPLAWTSHELPSPITTPCQSRTLPLPEPMQLVPSPHSFPICMKDQNSHACPSPTGLCPFSHHVPSTCKKKDHPFETRGLHHFLYKKKPRNEE